VTRVRLSEIPGEVRSEIRRFVRQMKGKLTYAQMAEEVKKKWGYELTPSQLARLAEPEKIPRRLPRDVVEFLESEFGSVEEGIKQVVAVAKLMSKPPPKHLEMAVKRLGNQLLDFEEAVRLLREMGYDDPVAVIRELAREGFCANEGGKLRFYRYRRPPEFALLSFFGFLPGRGRARAPSQQPQEGSR
jgi:hypothetical protein